MRKKVKKALVCAAAALAACGLTFAAACTGEYYRADALDGDYSYSEVVSNGGFAVEAGNFVYFINGVEANTATNTYGDVQKGALVRISKDNLAAGNYSDVQTVVPLVMYSGAYDGGIFIYGDRVYYSTPSTARDSSGEVLNSRLEFKSTKLDGTETMTGFYFQSESNDFTYRFVEVGGKVYLMYALSEILYGTEAHTNIHSVDLETGEDTVLAYNVASYSFDSKDLTNPYVYYTMNVTYNLGTTNAVTADYNQVYRVRADAKESPREYDFSYVEDYDAEEDPLYINLGEYVFDGRGEFSGMTQFNYGYDPATDSDTSSDDANTLSGYTYSIASYENGILYYTRTYYSSDDGNTPILLYTNDDEVGAEGWNPVTGNPVASDDYNGRALLYSASSLDGYTFIANESGVPVGAVYSESHGEDESSTRYALMYGTFSEGSLSDTFVMADVSGSITVLSTSEEQVVVDDGATETYNFLYFSVSGEGNGNSVHRIALGGSESDYTELPALEETEAHSNYQEAKILDVDASSSWYAPEVLSGHLFFAADTDDMSDYNYIMAFDMRDAGNSLATNLTMSNSDIETLNDLYEEIAGEENSVIADTDSDTYENLPNALRYAFLTRDTEAVANLVQDWVDAGEDEDYVFSPESAQKYLDFIAAEGDYADYADYSRTVNGEEVFATSRDYYYTLVGYMSDDDAESYIDGLTTDYLPEGPTDDGSWFDGLSTGAKVGFIVGVCAAGIIIIGAAVIIPIVVIRKKRGVLPQYTRRVRVDTTDDKDIDVYGTDENTEGADGENKE